MSAELWGIQQGIQMDLNSLSCCGPRRAETDISACINTSVKRPQPSVQVSSVGSERWGGRRKLCVGTGVK